MAIIANFDLLPMMKIFVHILQVPPPTDNSAKRVICFASLNLKHQRMEDVDKKMASNAE